jgi:predicted ATPase/class 3 adenylate cyclase
MTLTAIELDGRRENPSQAAADRGAGRRAAGAEPFAKGAASPRGDSQPMSDLPTGTITFLFTDIEGSTRLWEQHPQAMGAALTRHDALAVEIIQQHEGQVVKHRGEGDSFFAVFARAIDALFAATTLQRALCHEPWPADAPLRVRMALHTGDAALRDGDYLGAAVNRCARLRAAAHGGQVLLSSATQELVEDDLPAAVSLRDLGLHRLRDLHRAEHVFQLLHPELPAEFPPLQSLDVLPNNLPQQLTSFIGREQEMAEVKQLLATTRLLTLAGSGGTGKTRLALQVAADLLPEYGDGVWLVELAPLADPDLVPQAVATALGVREVPGEPLAQTLLDSLKPKRLLLVLDNCEHLLAACSTLADTLLRGCPGVCILSTSREGLNIGGETTYRLPSLSLPDPRHLPSTLESLSQYEAVRLFIDRALAVLPAFTVTNQNAPAVAQVCCRLDGIPLAIELAAAWVKALPVEKLNERLGDMFRLLTGGSRTALPRQQTLRALIDWSYDLLSEPERALLRRLSVFAGGWTLEAAEAVCGGVAAGCSSPAVSGGKPTGTDTRQPTADSLDDVLGLLTRLVGKSLVGYEEQEGEARYRLLETVRQYARDRLLESGEGETVRARHRDFFLALAEIAEPLLSTLGDMDPGPWLKQLEREHDNLRAALEWSAASEASEPMFRLAGALSPFWGWQENFEEGRRWLGRAMEKRHGAPASTWVKALHGDADMAYGQGDWVGARGLYQESLAIYRELGNHRCAGEVIIRLGYLALNRDGLAPAASLFEESLALGREVEDGPIVARSLFSLGHVAFNQGELAAARSRYEESLAIYRQLGHQRGIAMSLRFLGSAAFSQGDGAVAHSLYEEGLVIQGELGDKRGFAVLLVALGGVAAAEGDYPVARSHFDASLAIWRELGSKQGIAIGLRPLGDLAHQQGNYEAAISLFREAEAIYRELGAKWQLGFTLLDLARMHTDQGDYSTARSLCEECLSVATQVDTQWGIAWARHARAELAMRQGDYELARSLREESLAIVQRLGSKHSVAEVHLGLGEVALRQGDHEAAQSHYEASLALFREQKYQREVPRALEGLGKVMAEQGDPALAAALCRESLGLRQKMNDKPGIAKCLERLAEVLGAQGQTGRAARLLGASQALRETLGAPLPPVERPDYERQTAIVRSAMGKEPLAAAWAEGRAMALEQALAYALEEEPDGG